MIVTDGQLAGLTASWARCHGDRLPLGHALGRGSDEVWVRFHSLPGSKRYADDEGEYAEIMRRHFAVLGELGSGAPVWVVSTQWSEGAAPPADDPGRVWVHPDSRYWRTVRESDDPDDVYWHLYVSLEPVAPLRLTALLRAVADDFQAGVVLADRDLQWLYHPYDGGADVYARDRAQRDRLRDEHADWLSRHPRGL